MQPARVANARLEGQPRSDVSAVRSWSPALLPTRPLHCAPSATRPWQGGAAEEAPVGPSGFPWESGLMAYLHFKGSLGRYLCTLVYRGGVVLIGYQLSTLASPQHLTSLCSYSSQGRVAVSRNPSLQEVARGSAAPAAPPRATLSWPSPARIPEMGFKLTSGTNKPVSPSWWKSHRPENGEFKGFGGQMLHRAVAFCSFLHEILLFKCREPLPRLALQPSA